MSEIFLRKTSLNSYINILISVIKTVWIIHHTAFLNFDFIDQIFYFTGSILTLALLSILVQILLVGQIVSIGSV